MIELVGDAPEAAEAALLQAYPGRDPLREVLTGEMSLRQFGVLVEHLPPGNALERARFGRWSDTEVLLWSIESRIRDLAALTGNLWRPKGSPPREPEYIERPASPDELADRAAQDAYDAAMQAELDQL